MANSQFSLMQERRFAPFFMTQFLGAFNDNVFKNALVIMITFQVAGLTSDQINGMVNLCAGLFILPFFLFSASAGQLADKYEKSMLIRWIKLLEIVVMLGAAVAFYLDSVYALITLLFLMGAQSSLFGPVKYGILPQHLREDELVGGNGLIESGTFLAILIGTLLGGVLIGIDGGKYWVSLAIVVLAILGYWASCYIPPAAATDPELEFNYNPFSETWHNLCSAHKNRTVFLSVLGISWFWFYGATVLAQLPNYTRLTLGGNESVVTVLLTLFSLGIGLGSLACERLSGHKVELGLVPFGSIGLTVFGIDLYFAAPFAQESATLIGAAEFIQQPMHWRVMLDIVLIGLFGGFYIVPLYALVQSRSEVSHRSRIIAANNIINALFMVVSAILAILLLGAGLNIPQLILVTALMNAAVAVYIYTLVPEFLLRFLTWIMIHLGYRIDKTGLEHIPEQGPCLLVCNHVSYVDALVIGGCIRRPVRFVMDHRIFQTPILNFLFREAGVVPIAPAKENPHVLEQAFVRVGHYLDAGEVVCIFPEGRLTSDGQLGIFRSAGIERILARNPVPVVPMALQGLWGSCFSRKESAWLYRLPRRVRSRIGFRIAAPVAPEYVSAERLREQVAALRSDWA